MATASPTRIMRRLCILLVAAISTPAIAQSAPVSAPYTVSPGDVLDIAFRWTPEFNQSVAVQPDGHTTLMATGDVAVAGMNMQQLHDEIAKRSSSKLLDPEFTITVREADKPHFVVAGEVVTPGRYDLRTATTALQAVLLAGGSKEGGNMGNVILFRRLNSDTAEVHRLKFNKLDSGRKPADDMLLQPGDMILVSRDKLEHIGRFIKSFNLGMFFNPIPNSVL